MNTSPEKEEGFPIWRWPQADLNTSGKDKEDLCNQKGNAGADRPEFNEKGTWDSAPVRTLQGEGKDEAVTLIQSKTRRAQESCGGGKGWVKKLSV